jgi:hypothetical protein
MRISNGDVNAEEYCSADTIHACGLTPVRVLSAIAKLMRYKRVQAAVKHSFRALEVTCPRPGEFHPHFHVLLVRRVRILSRMPLDIHASRVGGDVAQRARS